MTALARRDGPALIKYDAAVYALAEARRIDDVKPIRDLAMAARLYAKQAKDVRLERDAAAIKLRAERRTGELLRELEKLGTRKQSRPARGVSTRDDTVPSLSDLGINRDQSSQWQRLATIPEEEFERRLAASEEPVTTAQMLGACGPITRQDRATHIATFIGALHEAFSMLALLKDYDTTELVMDGQTRSLKKLQSRVRECMTWLEHLNVQIKERLDG